jgi:hypothetical protein
MAYRGSRGVVRLILSIALFSCEWFSRTGRFASGEEPLCQLISRFCGPQTRCEAFGEEKLLLPSESVQNNADIARPRSINHGELVYNVMKGTKYFVSL